MCENSGVKNLSNLAALRGLVLTLSRDFTAMPVFCQNVPTYLDEMLSLCRYVHARLKQLHHNETQHVGVVTEVDHIFANLTGTRFAKCNHMVKPCNYATL